MKKSILLIILFLNVTFANAQWQNLFNGKDLTGWKTAGGKAKFYVENGEIIGESVANTPNSFLITEKEYTDFIFEAQFKIDEGINSGVQFRSKQRTTTGDVYGYQMEIDHSPRSWTGGIQEEGHRSWLYPLSLNEKAKSAYKLNQWNTFRIECVGNETKTYVNGTLTAHLLDDSSLKGFIGLQVHSLYKPEDEGKKMRWKTIRIQTENLQSKNSSSIYTVNLLANQLSESEKMAGWKLIWDGVSSNGWRSVFGTDFPSKGWEIKNDKLTTIPTDGTETGNDIVSIEKFGPGFELKFDFWYSEGANSGVKYFVDEQYKSGGKSGIGLEFQILDDERHPDAKLGSIGNRTLGSLYDLITSKKFSWAAARPNQWNQGKIVCYPDGKVEHYVNNLLALSYQRGGQIFDALVARSKYANWKGFGLSNQGNILLQHHGDNVSFRSIRIRELK
jgi:hypothetical protein